MITFNTDLWTYLKQQNRPAVLYGTGDGADKIIAVLEKNGIPVSGIFASPGFVRDRKFHGIQVEPFEKLSAPRRTWMLSAPWGSGVKRWHPSALFPW